MKSIFYLIPGGMYLAGVNVPGVSRNMLLIAGVVGAVMWGMTPKAGATKQGSPTATDWENADWAL